MRDFEEYVFCLNWSKHNSSPPAENEIYVHNCHDCCVRKVIWMLLRRKVMDRACDSVLKKQHSFPCKKCSDLEQGETPCLWHGNVWNSGKRNVNCQSRTIYCRRNFLSMLLLLLLGRVYRLPIYSFLLVGSKEKIRAATWNRHYEKVNWKWTFAFLLLWENLHFVGVFAFRS